MILTAIPVGFVAGLFGIGGGLITVLWCITNSGIDEDCYDLILLQYAQF